MVLEWFKFLSVLNHCMYRLAFLECLRKHAVVDYLNIIFLMIQPNVFYTSLTYLPHKDTEMQIVGGKGIFQESITVYLLGHTLLPADSF